MKSLLSILFGILLLISFGSVQKKEAIDYRAPLDISESSEVNAIPIKVVNPLYPRKAAIQKISGWVQMEFALDQKGHLTNIIILDSHPAIRSFEQP